MVQALGINKDNYKMGNKIWIYKIWYKIYKVWYKLWYKIYKLRYKIYKLYRRYLQASLDFGYLVGTPREQAGVLLDGEWMDEG